MKLKQTGIALIVAGVLSANAYASEAQAEAVLQPAQPVAAFTDADLNALFEQEAGKPMQLAALSGQEMKETEGAVWLNVAGGLIGGVAGMTGYINQNRNATGRGALSAFAIGAGMGVVAPGRVVGATVGRGLAAIGANAGSQFTVNSWNNFGSRRGWW